jgi:hypothetical protein
VVSEERDWDCFLDKPEGVLELSFGATLMKKEKSKNYPKKKSDQYHHSWKEVLWLQTHRQPWLLAL